MFDQLEPDRSGVVRVSLRAVISLAAGVLLTFLLPVAFGAIWPYLQDEHYQVPGFAVFIGRVLNLPATIYCQFFTLPPGLHKSDESLYCWSVGFFFNIPYYASIIFVLWSLVSWAKRRRERRAGAVVEFSADTGGS
jgi:hypothetical protein